MFDIDGVLADFVYGFTSFAHSMFGTPVTHTLAQPYWDGFPGVTAEQIDKIWNRIGQDPNFWRDLATMVPQTTFEMINHLNGLGTVYFATNRKGLNVLAQTRAWLEGEGIDSPNVVICGKKGEFAKAVGAHYLIDDKAGNAVYTQYESPSTNAYIIDRPYNQFDPRVIGGKVRRVTTVVEFIRDILEGK